MEDLGIKAAEFQVRYTSRGVELSQILEQASEEVSTLLEDEEIMPEAALANLRDLRNNVVAAFDKTQSALTSYVYTLKRLHASETLPY